MLVELGASLRVFESAKSRKNPVDLSIRQGHGAAGDRTVAFRRDAGDRFSVAAGGVGTTLCVRVIGWLATASSPTLASQLSFPAIALDGLVNGAPWLP